MTEKPRIVVSLTGSSGVWLTWAFLDYLAEHGAETYLIVSRWGEEILREEINRTLTDLKPLVTNIFHDQDLSAPLSSGSVRYDAMVILPCSMTTLARIAHGLADTLTARCAHVALKERRRLILCIRETPLSLINLRNMLTVSEAGGILMPMTLGFYLGNQLEDLVKKFAVRVGNLIGLPGPDLWRPDAMFSSED